MAWVASLGMYDGPGISEANDALWELVARRLTDGGVSSVPIKLDRDRPLEAIWSDPGLLLAQCCGYPLVTRYRGRLRYIATPRYSAPGCTGSFHRSRIIVRCNDGAAKLADLRGRCAALNARYSNSGMNLFRTAVAPLSVGGRFFSKVVETGSHEASLRAVATGSADVAAIDAVTFELLSRHQSALTARVRTIGWTVESAGLPFVTSHATPDALVDVLRSALSEVVRSAEARPALEMLLMEDVEHVPADAYDRLIALESEALRLRYPILA